MPSREYLPMNHRVFVQARTFLLICASAACSAASPDRSPTGQDAPRPANPSPAQPPPDKSVVLAEGQVLNYIGGGERNVKVTLHRKAADGQPGELIASTSTDEMGDFKLTAAEALKGPAIVHVVKTGYAPATREVTLGEGEFPPFVDVDLQGEYVLDGQVMDARDASAIVGAEVTVKTPFREWTEKTREGGRFRVQGLYPGDVEVIVQAKGFGRESQRLEILPDGNELVVSLKPERIVRLKTVDEAGQPIQGAVIACYDKDRDDFRSTATDEGGLAVLAGVNYDASGFALRVSHADFVSDTDFSREIALPAGQVESLHELRLLRAARIVGQVIDARTRNPLSDARLIAGAQISDFAPQTFSDVEGRFTLRSVPPGKTLVTVYRAGSAPDMAEVEVAAGQEHTLLLKLAEPRDIKGQVLNAADKPVAGAHVETAAWRGHDTLTLRALTDDEGRFVIQDAPADEFDVVATSPERARGRAHVTAQRNDVVITLSEAPADQPAARGNSPAPGSAAPEFAVTTLEGKALKLSELKGKTVLLDFWATWCGPCVAEVPNLLAVHQAYGSRPDFVMISVSLDRDEAALKKFIADRRMAWHHVFGDPGGADAAAQKFGVYAIPALFLIDREGKIVAGDLRGPGLKDAVGKALDQQP